MSLGATQLPGDPIPLRNMNSEGTVPKERLPDATDARALISLLLESNRSRARINAKVKGMLDGNRPYDPAKLRNAAQQFRVNVNWLEGRAKTSAAKVPYYDLFSQSTHYVDCTTDYGTVEQRNEHARIITEEVDATLKEWDEFDFNMQLMINDFVDYGKAFLMPNGKDDWTFSCIGQSKVLFPDGASSFPNKWDVVVVRHVFKVTDLFSYIRDKSVAEEAGWNPKAVEDAIFNAYPEQVGSASTMYDYNFVQQQIKDHDILQGIRCATVQAAHVFVKEFDGKVTHLITTETDVTRNTSTQDYAKDFMYKFVGKFPSMIEALISFVFETLDGSINGTQGMGHLIYSPMETKNRLICSMADLAFLRSSIVLQAQNGQGTQKVALTQVGPYTVLPPEFAVQQSTIMGDMDAPVAANGVLNSIIDNNTGTYRNEGPKPGNPRTLGEVKMDFMNSAQLSNSAVNRFYLSCDRLYAVVIPRMVNPGASGNGDGHKLAKECRKRILDRGVPEECISRKHLTVRAARVNGNGSMVMRQQALYGMMPLVPMLPEAGKEQWLRDAVAATTSNNQVDRYVPLAEVSRLPGDQTELALLENGVIKIGAPVTITSTQNDVIHAHVHLNAAAQASETLSQGANPAEVLMYLNGIGSHTAQHLQRLKGDPSRKQEFMVLEAQWKELAKTADMLGKQVSAQQQQQAEAQQKQMQAEAIANGVDPETRIMEEKAQRDMKIKEDKAVQNMNLKGQKSAQDMAIKDVMAASTIERQNAMASTQA